MLSRDTKLSWNEPFGNKANRLIYGDCDVVVAF